MAGFSTYSVLKDCLEDKVFTYAWSQSTPGTVSLNLTSCWKTGGRPFGGTDPATTPGTSYSNTDGGIIFPDLSTQSKYVYRFSSWLPGTTEVPITTYLFDRLVGVGGISLTTTGDKTINSTSLPRYTTGVEVLVFLEITTAGATTAPIVSMSSYTNQDGTTGRAGGTIAFPTTTTPAGALIGPLPLQAGDTGVRSVETLNVDTAAGGSSTVNLILVKNLISIGCASNMPSMRLSPLPYSEMVRIYDGATLMIANRGLNTGTVIQGEIGVVYN